MSKAPYFFLVAVFNAFFNQCFAQFGDCLYQHELEQPTELFHEVNLPPTAFAKINGSPYNFRVYGVATGGDTLEMPYAYPSFKTSNKSIFLKQLNGGKIIGAHRFTFEADPNSRIRNLYLDIANKNFEGHVRLEGADRLGDWQTILEDYRIIDLSDNGGPYRFTTLRFSASIFKYYRISIQGIENLSLNRVSTVQQSSLTVDTVKFEGRISELPRINGFPKTSVYNFSLAEDVLIDQLDFRIINALRYIRKIEVQILQDSFQQGKEMKYRYRTIGSGSVSNLDSPQTIGFTATVANQFRILVHNEDNQPLDILGIEAAVEQPRINVRFSGGERYYLAYGCESLQQIKPVYDIAQELASMPQRPPPIGLAPLNSFVIQNPLASTRGLFNNPLWLYGALVLVAGILGWMAFGMMKK